MSGGAQAEEHGHEDWWVADECAGPVSGLTQDRTVDRWIRQAIHVAAETEQP